MDCIKKSGGNEPDQQNADFVIPISQKNDAESKRREKVD
jgi:hypothetical protein